MNDKVLGLDIGGTKIRAILWDGKRVVKEKEKKTPKKRAVFIKTLRDLIARFGNGGGFLYFLIWLPTFSPLRPNLEPPPSPT